MIHKLKHTEELEKTLREVASELDGTTKDLEDTLEDHGIDTTNVLTLQSLQYFDDQVMLCSQCGWWSSEVGEFGGNDLNTCGECQGDKEEE